MSYVRNDPQKVIYSLILHFKLNMGCFELFFTWGLGKDKNLQLHTLSRNAIVQKFYAMNKGKTK